MAATTRTRKATITAPSTNGFDAFRASIVSNTKKGTIEDLSGVVDSISTGMIGLDIATGIGGFPIGRIIELYGMESCGKSTLLHHFIVEVQKRGFYPVLIETEGSVDRNRLRRIGVDLDQLIIYSPDSQEAAIDWIELAAKTASAQGGQAVIMLDSVAALAPTTMMEESADKKFRATAASVWSQQMPKIMHTLREHKATLILVNQMREGMDLYAPPSTPGGKAIKFAASMRVLMRRKVIKSEDKTSLEGIEGQEINFIIEKNKLATPYRKGMAYLPANNRVDLVEDVMSRAIERGVIEADVKFEEGELVSKKNYFTIIPDDEIAAAIRKDIKRADAANAELPGLVGGPYINPDLPFSMRFEKELLRTLDLAPNLVDALRDKIYKTLAEEANIDLDENPFEVRLREAIRDFDAGAEDGLKIDEVVAQAASESEDDDLAEFAK